MYNMMLGNEENQGLPRVRSTTVIGVIRNGQAAIGADGQVTVGNTVMKHSTKKLRRLYNGKVMVGFAGATADAFSLMQRFDEKLESYGGALQRSAIELVKDWRTDRYLRKLEAMMIAMNTEQAFVISGNGDVVETDDNIVAIGSGGSFALAAARALAANTDMSAPEIVRKALEIAADICIYTNHNISVEEV